MSRPRLCFVAPNAYPVLSGRDDIAWIGGAEVQQVVIAKGLAERGFDVSMICLDFGQPDGVVIDGIKVYRAFRRGAGIPGLRYFTPRITSLWKAMGRADADIYYQRGAGFLTGLVVAFCRRRVRVSVFAVAGQTKIKLARDRITFEHAVRRADSIFVQNPAQKEYVRRAFGCDSQIVPNFYAPLSQGSLPLASRDQILWVAAFRPLKRPEFFIDLASALPEYRFTMVGGEASGHQRYFDEMKMRAKNLANVRFAGFLPYTQADEIFDHAALFVNTSETEGFPNTFLQAWARGIPTISFIDCGARANGQPLGYIVDSWPDLKDTVVRLMADGDIRSGEGIRCRRYFDQEHLAAKALGLYEELFVTLYKKSKSES